RRGRGRSDFGRRPVGGIETVESQATSIRIATRRSKSSMSIFDKLRSEKLLSFTLILFTLSIGIVIGTLIDSSVRAAKDNNNASAPGATPLAIPNPVELSN